MLEDGLFDAPAITDKQFEINFTFLTLQISPKLVILNQSQFRLTITLTYHQYVRSKEQWNEENQLALIEIVHA